MIKLWFKPLQKEKRRWHYIWNRKDVYCCRLYNLYASVMHYAFRVIEEECEKYRYDNISQPSHHAPEGVKDYIEKLSQAMREALFSLTK